jgi:translation initiation factor IF-1
MPAALPAPFRSRSRRKSGNDEQGPASPRARLAHPSTGKERDITVKEETIELEGEVTEALRNGNFRIQLDNGHETLGYVAGKMRRYRIRINLGDRIKIQLSPYDLNRGRIVYRYK